jgi:hypothetical protein
VRRGRGAALARAALARRRGWANGAHALGLSVSGGRRASGAGKPCLLRARASWSERLPSARRDRYGAARRCTRRRQPLPELAERPELASARVRAAAGAERPRLRRRKGGVARPECAAERLERSPASRRRRCCPSRRSTSRPLSWALAERSARSLRRLLGAALEGSSPSLSWPSGLSWPAPGCGRLRTLSGRGAAGAGAASLGLRAHGALGALGGCCPVSRFPEKGARGAGWKSGPPLAAAGAGAGGLYRMNGAEDGAAIGGAGQARGRRHGGATVEEAAGAPAYAGTTGRSQRRSRRRGQAWRCLLVW